MHHELKKGSPRGWQPFLIKNRQLKPRVSIQGHETPKGIFWLRVVVKDYFLLHSWVRRSVEVGQAYFSEPRLVLPLVKWLWERLLATLHVYEAEANNFFVVFNYLATSQNYFDAKLAFYQEAIHHIRVMLLMKNLKGSTGSTT